MRYNDFDSVAGYYDWLARLVFGRAIDRSQEAFVKAIPAGARLVILGGGTGRILDYLSLNRPDIIVTFVDASERMLARAKRRQPIPTIEFIHGTEDSLPEGRFDVAMAPFFLDMFPEEKMLTVVEKVSSRLLEGGQWIVADFVTPNRWWQRLLLAIMYTFFRRTTNLMSRELPDWTTVLANRGWEKKESIRFYAGFIEAARFERLPK